MCNHVQTCANMITRGSLSSLWLLLMASMNKCGLWMTMSDVEMTNNHKQPISPSGSGVRAQAFRRGGQLRRPLLWHRTSHDGHSPHPSREPPEPPRAETLCSLLTTRLSALWLCRDSVDLKTSTLNSTVRPLTPFDALWRPLTLWFFTLPQKALPLAGAAPRPGALGKKCNTISMPNWPNWSNSYTVYTGSKDKKLSSCKSRCRWSVDDL